MSPFLRVPYRITGKSKHHNNNNNNYPSHYFASCRDFSTQYHYYLSTRTGVIVKPIGKLPMLTAIHLITALASPPLSRL